MIIMTTDVRAMMSSASSRTRNYYEIKLHFHYKTTIIIVFVLLKYLVTIVLCNIIKIKI